MLAPPALLLLLEPRCAHFVIEHFNIVCCGVVRHCSHTAHTPLALLILLEPRCAHFVIEHFNNIVCCGVVRHCSHTAHIQCHDDKLVTCYKDVSEHYRE